jgi:outer membrane lipopolysaccharide assembly protein LptE/RlpB
MNSFEFRVLSFEGETKKSKSRNYISVLGLLFLLAVTGCGYQFVGKGEEFPKDVHTVFIEPFVNRTKEVGLEREFTTALKSELHQKGYLQVVERPEEADAVLTGVLRSFSSRVVGVNRRAEALQYELVLVLDANLRRRSPDELLWRTQGARFSDLFAGSRAAVVTTSSDFRNGTLNPRDVPQFTDIQLTETFKQDARSRLAEGAAHDLQTRLLELF